MDNCIQKFQYMLYVITFTVPNIAFVSNEPSG